MRISTVIGATRIEVEGDIKEAFTELAQASEIFGHGECGACGSKDVMPVVRDWDGNTYYEMRCNKCHSVMGFGQRRGDGALFPRRKDKDGNWLPNNGWVNFRNATNNTSDEPF